MVQNERRFALRERTRDGHVKLDAAVGAFATLADYRRYVAHLGAFRSAMDEVLQTVAWPEDWVWRPTQVTDSLLKDAADLGLPRPVPTRPAIDLTDRNALLGALYVLEGATLGARVLRGRATTLGLDETFGARHLAVMSNDIAQWQAFLLLLDKAPRFDIDRAAASANAVFALARRCFESELSIVQ